VNSLILCCIFKVVCGSLNPTHQEVLHVDIKMVVLKELLWCFSKQLRRGADADPEERCRAAFGGVQVCCFVRALVQGCHELVLFPLHPDLCWWI